MRETTCLRCSCIQYPVAQAQVSCSPQQECRENSHRQCIQSPNRFQVIQPMEESQKNKNNNNNWGPKNSWNRWFNGPLWGVFAAVHMHRFLRKIHPRSGSCTVETGYTTAVTAKCHRAPFLSNTPLRGYCIAEFFGLQCAKEADICFPVSWGLRLLKVFPAWRKWGG